jgi:hypothetical protein
MRAIMLGQPSRTARRALVAALVLYGFLVQALLAGWFPAGAVAPLDDVASMVVCQRGTGDSPLPQYPADHAHQCCLAACMAGAPSAAALPDPGSSAAWPARPAPLQIAWQLDLPAPPSHSTSPLVTARGPPRV